MTHEQLLGGNGPSSCGRWDQATRPLLDDIVENVTEWDATESARLVAGIRAVLAMTDRQAEDEGLWFVAETAAEAYLQQELRSLHECIERTFVPLAPRGQRAGVSALDPVDRVLDAFDDHED